MTFRILFSLIILISIGFLYSCNDDEDNTEEIIETPPEARIEVDPDQGYFELDTSFNITSYSSDHNTSADGLRLNWYTNNGLCEMCELEEFTNLSSFSLEFENSEIDEDKRIDLILLVTNEFGLSDSITHTIIFENEAPIIDFKISHGESAGLATLFTLDLSNSTDVFGSKEGLFLKIDKYDNGSWDYESAYENDSSFIITTSSFSPNTTTKIKAQIEDSLGNIATKTKSIRLEHGIIIISD